MRHDLSQVVWIYRVQDVEEVVSGGAFQIWIFILEVDVECRIILHLRPQLVHRQLIPMWNMDEVNLLLRQQSFLLREDISEEDFVHLILRRNMEIDYREISKGMMGTYDACPGRRKSPPLTSIYRKGLESRTE